MRFLSQIFVAILVTGGTAIAIEQLTSFSATEGRSNDMVEGEERLSEVVGP